jgi:hypothetical protein
LKTKISFNENYLRLFITQKSGLLLKPYLRKEIKTFVCAIKKVHLFANNFCQFSHCAWARLHSPFQSTSVPYKRGFLVVEQTKKNNSFFLLISSVLYSMNRERASLKMASLKMQLKAEEEKVNK